MTRIKVNLDKAEWRGQWALITGASSGIGLEFASQLAAKGINLILVARRAELLHSLARKLAGQHGISTRASVADLSDPGASEGLRYHLDEAGIRIRLLVNNAAFGRWGRFEAQDSATYRNMLQVNAIALMTLCRELLPHLTSYTTAAIINVSSPAAYQPVPYMAVYAASKAFVQQFSQALYGEWGPRGILVQTLLPGPTSTEFDDIAEAYASALKDRDQPETAVTASLRGLASGCPVVCTAKGALRQRLFALMPARLVIRAVARMFTPPLP